jgi:putative transcriptional regulator
MKMVKANKPPHTDAEIHAAALSDPDAQPLTPEQLSRMRRVSELPLSYRVRRQLRLSQTEFAARFRIPVGTIRDWDQGRTQPDAAATALLKAIARYPDEVAKAQEAAG